MRSARGASGGPDPARSDRAEAAARRLALLAADLGADAPRGLAEPTEPGAAQAPAWDDYTRVVPARRAVPPPAPSVVAPPDQPPALPRPGRHASRRRARGLWAVGASRMPGLGSPQLTVIALLVALGLAVTTWWVVRDRAEPVPAAVPSAPDTAGPLVAAASSEAPTDPALETSTEGTVTVDVTGKVRRPGIVVLDSGARVVDAVKAAGGARPGVDLSGINLARVLVDGEQIVVGAAAASVPQPPGGTAPPGAPTALVNLNTATPAELETLPDVGPVTAQAIIAWRDEHGGFTTVDELLEVDGIGELTLEGIAPYVTV